MEAEKPKPEPPKLTKKELKKLAKLQAEAELFKKLKIEELKREIHLQAINRKKVDQKWREIMFKIKEPMFRKEIEIMWHVFERTLDKKDHLVSCTMKLMDVADDQFQRTVASFCDTIDTMINKFLEDFELLSKDNDIRTAKLLKRGQEEADKIMDDHNIAETHLQLMLYHGSTSAENYKWTKRGENIVKEDEEKNKYATERDNLRTFLEKIYSTTWDQYKATLRAYVVNVADNQKQLRILRRKENTIADIIAKQAKKIANSDGLLRRLRTDLQAYESGTKQAGFRDRRNRHRAACFKLKNILIEGNNNDAKRLGFLVRTSDEAVEWLKEAEKKVERILRLAALCRRFETQKEKVLPFGTQAPLSPVNSKSTGEKKNSSGVESNEAMVANAIAVTGGLSRLWQRVAYAEMSKRALLREKSILEEENSYIAQHFKELKKLYSELETSKCLCSQSLKRPQEQNRKSIEVNNNNPTLIPPKTIK